jgi:hypothetical protein
MRPTWCGRRSGEETVLASPPSSCLSNLHRQKAVCHPAELYKIHLLYLLTSCSHSVSSGFLDMPLLPKVFSRRDKSSTHLTTPEKVLGRSHSSSTNQSSDYVVPDSGTPSDGNGSQSGRRTPSQSKHPKGLYANAKASGSKLKLSVPGFRRKATEPEKGTYYFLLQLFECEVNIIII